MASGHKFIEAIASMLSDLNIDKMLAIYPLTGRPALFFDRPPADHEGFPFMALQVDSILGASQDQNKLLRLADVRFHVWSHSAGHSFEVAQDLIRLLELTYDRQRIENTEIGACRMFHSLKASFEEEPEEDDIIHMLSGFTARGYSTVLQDNLAT